MQNTLYTGDNLHILTGMNSECVDLIYLDPPFNSKRLYSAPIGSKAAGSSFKDTWTWQDVDEDFLECLVSDYPYLAQYIRSIGVIHSDSMMSYVTYMTQRLIELHRVLKSTGSLYLHCDPTASHYLKVVLDRIFGKDNYRNEIVWHYQAGTKGSKRFGKKHDIILAYGKGDDTIFNRQSKPVSNPKIYNKVDGNGRNYLVNGQGTIYYLDNGQTCDDVWTWAQEKHISSLSSQSKERTGYPTQKPLALLDRIIKASSNEGDVVLDPFCGCATTCVAAELLYRKWIGIDISAKAAELVVTRLSDTGGLFSDFISTSSIPVRTDLAIVKRDITTKQALYEQQKGLCSGCGVDMEIRHFEIDHIIPRAKGGGDYYENYQLLCGHCNKTKGARPMEYLRIKIKAMRNLMETTVGF